MVGEVFVVSKTKNTVPWTYVVSDLNGEEITGSFYEKELQKTNQQKFRREKVLKRKGDKLYIKWKGYDNLFISSEVLEEILTLKLICLNTQQKLI